MSWRHISLAEEHVHNHTTHTHTSRRLCLELQATQPRSDCADWTHTFPPNFSDRGAFPLNTRCFAQTQKPRLAPQHYRRFYRQGHRRKILMWAKNQKEVSLNDGGHKVLKLFFFFPRLVDVLLSNREKYKLAVEAQNIMCACVSEVFSSTARSAVVNVNNLWWQPEIKELRAHSRCSRFFPCLTAATHEFLLFVNAALFSVWYSQENISKPKNWLSFGPSLVNTKKVIGQTGGPKKTKLRDTKGTIFKINFKIKYTVFYIILIWVLWTEPYIVRGYKGA